MTKGFLLFTLIILCSCSRFKVKRAYDISSSPSKAKVSLYTPLTKEYVELGQTPMVIDEEIQKKYKIFDQEYVALKVARPGYAVEHLIIDTKIRKTMKYFATLNAIEVWTDREKELSSNIANKLSIKVQKINHNIFKKNLDKALSDVEKLIDQYPKAHVFYDIKGSILLLKGQKRKSLASYQKSLTLNPDNSDSKKMIEKIQGKRR